MSMFVLAEILISCYCFDCVYFMSYFNHSMMMLIWDRKILLVEIHRAR